MFEIINKRNGMSNTTETMNLKSMLHEYFGFDNFRGNQEAIINSLFEGNDTLVIMPTGGGKSLCYQLPALMSEGTAIIVSPLIALMKNQVDLIRGNHSESEIAHFLNSSLTKNQQTKVKSDIKSGKTKMLYVAPETLQREDNLEFLKGIKVSFLAVDEAHCISEWGHDFRPEYRKIRDMIKLLGQKIPIIALTATATPKVQSDIIKTLKLNKPKSFISSFNRSNLYYEVREKSTKDAATKNIIQTIKMNAGKSCIIYVRNRASCDELAQILNVNGVRALGYHAGMDSKSRSEAQDKFLNEEVDVIVATIAFGMGIDKPDIRFVFHYDIPKSIENYYQETGRAGRDGLEGNCITYYSPKDIEKLEKFLKDKTVAEREMGAQLLIEMEAYAESSACRRKFLLHYFGENFDAKRCDNKCDNCAQPKEKINGKDYIYLALSAVNELKEQFTIPYLVKVILGKKSQDIADFKHDKSEVFGKGTDKDDLFWNSILRQCILNNFLTKDIEQYGVLKLTDEGRAFLKSPEEIKISLNRKFSSGDDDDDILLNTESGGNSTDPQLFSMLKDLRKSVAKKHKLPPYVIFQDPSLEDMATQYPITIDELCNTAGVSKGKALKFGKEFLELIAKYCEENEIDRPTDIVVKQVANKSGLKVYIIQQIDRKIPLVDIAKSKSISMKELMNEIYSIITSGSKLDINYYVEDILDEDQLDEIFDYFKTAESDSIDDAYKALKDDFSEDELHLGRAVFMSEHAN